MPRLQAINFWGVVVLSLCLSLARCGAEGTDTGENFGNILDSPEGIVLTEEEHVYGWGRDDCLMCHNLNNIHRLNLTDVAVDIEEIQRIAAEEGEASCMDCHGDNGTSP